MSDNEVDPFVSDLDLLSVEIADSSVLLLEDGFDISLELDPFWLVTDAEQTRFHMILFLCISQIMYQRYNQILLKLGDLDFQG